METIELDKWTHPAHYQEKLGCEKVRCRLCPHNCILENGKHGICRTRVNLNGELYSTAYGNPCSLGVDPVEKKPLYHFYPGSKIFSLATQGCNFRCLNCQNWQISQSPPSEVDHYNMMPMDVIRRAINNNCNSIAFTYSEPTVFYEYMYETARLAHENSLNTVLVSNGYINEEPLFELTSYLDAANIDLKCFDNDIYYKLTGGELQPVLDSLKILRNNGVWLEITNLIIPEWTDDFDKIRSMCNWLVENDFEETPIHFSRFFPTYKLSELPPTNENTMIKAAEIAREAGLKYVYLGNMHVSNGENTYCSSCKQLIVERNGFKVESNGVKSGHCEFCSEKIAGRWD